MSNTYTFSYRGIEENSFELFLERERVLVSLRFQMIKDTNAQKKRTKKHLDNIIIFNEQASLHFLCHGHTNYYKKKLVVISSNFKF